MLTRNIRAKIGFATQQDAPSGTDNEVCRMCLREREKFSHLYECWEVEQVFGKLVDLAAIHRDFMRGR